jgi:Flp pilus assembly protein TadG
MTQGTLVQVTATYPCVLAIYGMGFGVNSMTHNNIAKYGRESENRRGQIMIFMALTMPVIFGLTAIVFDFGMVYINQNRLNGSTQAAALAGAEAMAQAGRRHRR